MNYQSFQTSINERSKPQKADIVMWVCKLCSPPAMIKSMGDSVGDSDIVTVGFSVLEGPWVGDSEGGLLILLGKLLTLPVDEDVGGPEEDPDIM